MTGQVFEMLCVSLLALFQHGHSSVASILIDARLAQYEAPILGKHGDFFKMVLSPVVRHLLCFECQDVDNSC